VIALRGVSKKYGKINAVDQISLDVPNEGSLAIIGPSGSGKTTLLRLIAGLEVPDDGEILINGELMSAPGWAVPPHLRGIGFMFQTSSLWPHMTVAQNIMFGLHRLPIIEGQRRLQELLMRTSIGKLAHRYPHELSGGEARRVALARALAPAPACLLLDEPLTNLDPDLKRQMLSLILEQVERSKACLVYVTHDESEALKVSERVFILKDKKLEHFSELPQKSDA
jgi:iron(III) transport system ATP-binding protein